MGKSIELNPIQRASRAAGGPSELARRMTAELQRCNEVLDPRHCTVDPGDIQRWMRDGRMPLTDLLGRTFYSRAAAAAQSEVSEYLLLEMTRSRAGQPLYKHGKRIGATGQRGRPPRRSPAKTSRAAAAL